MRSILLVLAVLGCGSKEPADVAGNYTMAVTNGQDGCAFGWNVSEENTNIPVIITQSDEAVSADVGGFAQIFLNVAFGGHIFTGTVVGSELALDIDGALQPMTQNQCSFHYIGHLSGRLEGDFLSGSIVYTSATNGHADCGSLEGCRSEQAFNGMRPPPPP